jgi:hypothetical protein
MSGKDTTWWAVKPGRYVHGPASPILRLLMNSDVNKICVVRHTIPMCVARGESGEYDSNIIRKLFQAMMKIKNEMKVFLEVPRFLIIQVKARILELQQQVKKEAEPSGAV